MKQPAESGPDGAQQTVSVHCLAGSSFELEVNSAERARDVAKRIAAKVGHRAEVLVLTDSVRRSCVGRDMVSHVETQPKAQPGHRTSQQPAELDFRQSLQPELGGHPTTQQPAEFDLWL